MFSEKFLISYWRFCMFEDDIRNLQDQLNRLTLRMNNLTTMFQWLLGLTRNNNDEQKKYAEIATAIKEKNERDK